MARPRRGAAVMTDPWSMSEAQLQLEVRKLCESRGLAVQHVGDPRRAWLPGWPDLVIIGTTVVWAELKRQGEELDPEQRRVRHRLIAAGQQYRIWKPRDLLCGVIAAELAAMSRTNPGLPPPRCRPPVLLPQGRGAYSFVVVVQFVPDRDELAEEAGDIIREETALRLKGELPGVVLMPVVVFA